MRIVDEIAFKCLGDVINLLIKQRSVSNSTCVTEYIMNADRVCNFFFIDDFYFL